MSNGFSFGDLALAYPITTLKSAFQSPEEVAIGTVMAGYDAIFQFRLDFINAQFWTSLDFKPYKLEANYQFTDAMLSDHTKSVVAAIVSKANQSAPASQTHLGPFWVQWFRIWFGSPLLEISPDPDKEVIIRWPVMVWLRLARGKLMTPNEGQFLDEPFASGKVAISGSIVLEKDPAKHQTWAVVHPHGLAASVFSADPLFKELLHGFLPSQNLKDAIDKILKPLMVDTIRATPTMCLGGVMQAGESLPGYAHFQVYKAKCKEANQWVICICLDAKAGGAGTGLTQVKSFLGGRNFAYCFSQGLAEEVVAQRWARPSTLKSFSTSCQVPLQDPDNEDKTVYGSATISWVWGNLVSAKIIHGVEGSGALRVKAIGEMTILELKNHKGQKVNQDDYPDLFQPTTKEWVIDYIMFESAPPAVNQNVAVQGLQLLQPLYRPTASPLYLSSISGLLSGCTFGGIVRGNLMPEAI